MSSTPYLAVYRALFDTFGPQRWWPAQTSFEVLVGAVLTQNTAWRNVEQAIARLRAASLLHGPALLATPPERLAELIRPAGYHQIKTRRLLALCEFLATHDALAEPRRLRERGSLPALRRALLGVHGVGGETADAILVYGLELPSFVVDAYTRRIFERLGLLSGAAAYEAIQAQFHAHLPADAALFNEYHALIVALGKAFCRPQPRCRDCPLRSMCHHADTRVSDRPG
ncbi:MAG: endonuclease III domain-containing protein [Pseudomonadota bacterium]